MKKVLILILFNSINAFAQGEYFKNGETGIIVGREYAHIHDIQQNGLGIGFSYYGRIDFSMTKTDRNALFDRLNSYSITIHIIKQNTKGGGSFPGDESFPFSFAISAFQSNSNIRTYNFTPYIRIPIGHNVDMILHTGISASRNVTDIFGNNYLYSYLLGASILTEISKDISIGVEGGVNISKVYPGFGIGGILAIKLFK